MQSISKSVIIGIILLVLAVTGALYFIMQNRASQQATQVNTNANENSTDASDSACTGITQSTTEGPYFVRDTAKVADNNLNYTNRPGTRIKVSGYVYAGSDNAFPLENAKIELWQTDDEGSYHPNGNGTVTDYKPEDIELRGYVTTDDKGYYEFTSIYPGYYEGRARHIHARISADGQKEVITQIMFQPKPGDGVDLEDDSIAKALPACHLIQMKEENGLETGSIDFRLE
jgi:protocatechuate 3,4-dioxygenase beta subunit